MTPAREWLVTLRIQVARADVGFAFFLGLEGLFMTFVPGYQAESLRAQAHEGWKYKSIGGAPDGDRGHVQIVPPVELPSLEESSRSVSLHCVA